MGNMKFQFNVDTDNIIAVGRPISKASWTESWGAIVIGSGIGGLAAAALLARHAGKRVQVLERLYTAGGFTHAFRRPVTSGTWTYTMLVK